jgi:hypothetical protein
MSGWFSAHLTIEARKFGAARKPIMGSRPVAGRPRLFFGLAFMDIVEYWFSLKSSRGEDAGNKTIACGPCNLDKGSLHRGCTGSRNLATRGPLSFEL